jgi:DNA polymerase-3 subunit chi
VARIQAAQTPVVLTASLEDKLPHHQVLMNLGSTLPGSFASFERLLEIVGTDAQELQAGRERYRFYRDRGYPLVNHSQDA